MIRRALLALLGSAAFACGNGSARVEAPPAAKERGTATAPADGSLPAGWTALDEPTFSARIPANFERHDDGAQRRVTASKSGVHYMVSWQPLPPQAEGDTERAFDVVSTAFFRSCRGARLRLVHADTLEHKTVTVDGTCGQGKAAMGQVHVRGTDIFELYIVLDGGLDAVDQEELRGFFRAFRVKSS